MWKLRVGLGVAQRRQTLQHITQIGPGITPVHPCRLCRPPNYAERARCWAGSPSFVCDRFGIVHPASALNYGDHDGDYGRVSEHKRLFRRLRSGIHGRFIELYAARLVEVGLSKPGTWRSLNVVSNLLA